MKSLAVCTLVGVTALSVTGPMTDRPATPPTQDTAIVGLAGVYGSLADSILANKRSEKQVVLAILGVERDLTLAALHAAKENDDGARAASLQTAARHIGEFATEGGAIIEPIRNKLLQGGHHHHAQDSGPEALFDKGYVVVAKKHKREALGLAKRCARLVNGKATVEQINDVETAFSALAQRCLE